MTSARNLFVTFIVATFFILGLAGCSNGTENSPAQGEAQKTSGSAPEQQAQPENRKNNGSKKGKEPLRFEMSELTVEPGQTYMLQTNYTDGVRFESSDPERISVDHSGEIHVAETAASGVIVKITATRDGESAHAELTIQAVLPATVGVNDAGIPVVANPESLTVLVNKQRSLPDQYVPDDLVVPDVLFSFSGEHEKQQLREPAARALEALFRKAKEDGIELRAVSGYRSFGTQTAIFNWNVQTQGEEQARRYSAYPGTSEHQTGLAMDVSSRSVNYGLIEEFGETEEGKWLAANCAEFGFIIRYPNGKEHITGYAYEPWHLRYVGTDIAKVIMDSGGTLEEYFEGSIPVLNQ